MQKFFTSALAQKTIRVSDVPANHVDKHPKNSFSSVSYRFTAFGQLFFASRNRMLFSAYFRINSTVLIPEPRFL